MIVLVQRTQGNLIRGDLYRIKILYVLFSYFYLHIFFIIAVPIVLIVSILLQVETVSWL